ncbi:hypothetical protein GGI13_007705, partial [Coemansia sp. RSA 455]
MPDSPSMKQQQRRPFITRSDGDGGGTNTTASPLGSPTMEHIELDTLGVRPKEGDDPDMAKYPLSGNDSEVVLDDDSTAVEDAFQEHYVKIDYEGGGGFSLKKLWRFVGPGLLVSQALLDPGNIESDISQADTSGYKLLWLLLVAHIICIFVQSLAARLGVISGRHLAQHIRLQYPRPFATVMWLLSELAIIGADIQEVIGTATALHILTSMPIWAGVVITAVDSFLFLYVQRLGVRVTELVFGLMVTILAV